MDGRFLSSVPGKPEIEIQRPRNSETEKRETKDGRSRSTLRETTLWDRGIGMGGGGVHSTTVTSGANGPCGDGEVSERVVDGTTSQGNVQNIHVPTKRLRESQRRRESRGTESTRSVGTDTTLYDPSQNPTNLHQESRRPTHTQTHFKECLWFGGVPV